MKQDTINLSLLGIQEAMDLLFVTYTSIGESKSEFYPETMSNALRGIHKLLEDNVIELRHAVDGGVH